MCGMWQDGLPHEVMQHIAAAVGREGWRLGVVCRSWAQAFAASPARRAMLTPCIASESSRRARKIEARACAGGWHVQLHPDASPPIELLAGGITGACGQGLGAAVCSAVVSAMQSPGCQISILDIRSSSFGVENGLKLVAVLRAGYTLDGVDLRHNGMPPDVVQAITDELVSYGVTGWRIQPQMHRAQASALADRMVEAEPAQVQAHVPYSIGVRIWNTLSETVEVHSAGGRLQGTIEPGNDLGIWTFLRAHFVVSLAASGECVGAGIYQATADRSQHVFVELQRGDSIRAGDPCMRTIAGDEHIHATECMRAIVTGLRQDMQEVNVDTIQTHGGFYLQFLDGGGA
jgi:hypothetical protein